ncbi:tetratricopeptide repeat protein [uncultured Victivallis sp.]|uniref:tetratricopeptide repeat protein n=1 Tax=uncultured Victivallis sp. TaxID=354118 RepID=UPI00258922CC|nr:tetratricopeptide repeat protein [uncultured Victivallis sp.]
MKNFFTITETAFAAMLLASAVAVHAADEATERRLGIRAVANGDYSNAVNFFKSALALSGEDQEKWAANAVDLAAAKLRTGDLAGARELLAEFRSRFPARSAGLLPGEIMIAERKYDDAEKFFQSLAASAADPELSCQARYALALSRLHQNKFAAALADLEQLERENADLPSWAARAHLTRIYTLLASGDLKTAEELLKQDKYRKELPDRYRRLELALMLKRRQFDSFYRLWPEIAAEAGDRQDKLLYDLAVSGALQAAAAKQYDAAVRLLNDGFRFAGNDLERRNALRELINVDAVVDPERAADAIKRYLEFFPEANDRTELLLRGARLLASVKSYDRAIALFTQVTGDNRIPTEQRLGAAREAAVTAQAAGRPEVARRMYRYLIEQAETPDQRLEGNYLFGEYSFREKNFRQAANLLKTVADSGSNRADAARYRLLQSLVELKRYKEAEPVAEALRRSPVQTHATSADFYRALLLEKAGHSAEARSEYLKFLVAHPDSEYSPRALFSAAELAMELREYPAAVREFFEFAEKNPKSDSAPAALYQAMQSGYFARNAAETRRAIELLEKKYPESPVVIESRLQLADYLIRDADYDGALAQLAEVEKYPAAKSPETASELLYDHARIARLQRQDEDALKFLEQLLKEHPSNAFGAEAALSAGNLKADQGNYREALKFYERALTLGPAGRNAELTRGRIADARYNIYAETLDKNDLDQAAAIYRELADGSGNPQVMLQSLYKYGKCCELMDEREDALRAYEKLLYLAGDLQRRGIAPDPVWTSRGAYQAVLLNLKDGTPASARRALEDIRLYEELKLTGAGEDFARIKQEIKQRYNLEEK